MSRSHRKVLFASLAWLGLAGCHQSRAEPTQTNEVNAGSAGSGCVEPECQDPSPTQAPASCAATLCAENTYCDDIGGEAKCLPLPSCDAQECPAGQHCELVQVQCVRAPCPRQPMCTPDAA
jgi:hypothetical protein